jgi:hypothetical protein
MPAARRKTCSPRCRWTGPTCSRVTAMARPGPRSWRPMTTQTPTVTCSTRLSATSRRRSSGGAQTATAAGLGAFRVSSRCSTGCLGCWPRSPRPSPSMWSRVRRTCMPSSGPGPPPPPCSAASTVPGRRSSPGCWPRPAPWWWPTMTTPAGNGRDASPRPSVSTAARSSWSDRSPARTPATTWRQARPWPTSCRWTPRLLSTSPSTVPSCWRRSTVRWSATWCSRPARRPWRSRYGWRPAMPSRRGSTPPAWWSRAR